MPQYLEETGEATIQQQEPESWAKQNPLLDFLTNSDWSIGADPAMDPFYDPFAAASGVYTGAPTVPLPSTPLPVNPLLPNPNVTPGFPGGSSSVYPGFIDKVTDWIGSDKGQDTLEDLTAWINAYLEGRISAEQFQARMAQSDRQQLIQEIMMQVRQNEQMRQRQGELGVNYAQMVPQRQTWRQQQSIWSDVLPQLRNAQVTPPGDMGRFMPQVSGGLRLPEGGLSQATLGLFSPEARAQAERDLDTNAMVASQGAYRAPNYAAYYPNAGVGGAQSAMNAYGDAIAAQQQQRWGKERTLLDSLLEKAMLDEANKKQAGKSTGSKIGGAVGGAATGAKLGSAFGPWGTAIGAIGGGLFGWLS